MKNFAEITGRYINKPFGDHNCMGFLYDIYTELGITVPDKFEDLSLYTYMKDFKKDPYGVQIKMLKLIRTLGQPSSAKYPRLGDLLVISMNTCRANVIRPGFFPAIYAGRNHAIASFFKGGVTTVNLDKHHRPIVARRLI